jgi:hypothetical protein
MEFKSNPCSSEHFRQEITVKDVVVYVLHLITCHSNEQDLLFSQFFCHVYCEVNSEHKIYIEIVQIMYSRIIVII